MRTDPAPFAAANQSASKRPRFVIGIEFDIESIFLTSHTGISGVPGVVMENVLRRPSAVSQRIVPDEGRSEIGSFAFSLVDLDSVFTEEIREKLGDGKGLRGKKVRFWTGYARFAPADSGGFGSGSFGSGSFGEGDPDTGPEAVFGEFQLFQTQIITGASYDDGVYEIKCADITREQRADIFDPKKTTLKDTLAVAATTVSVYSTVGFQPVYHGPSYSDGPNGVYGYIKVDNEWIRYTGFTSDSFTGCTRGVLNTKAVEHTVDPASDADRRPKVEEGIYLELPAVKLCYAILTGIIHGTSPTQTLPPHWHLGIDPDLVRLSDFTGIGPDLWDPSLDTLGFVTRFQGLSKIDGKKFLETELYMLLGCYSPIYSDGTIGLKRMNQVLENAAYVVELNATNVISHDALVHDFGSLHNRLQIDWNWNGDRFTRSTLFVDAPSISAHGPAPLKKLAFKGLHGSRHTEAIIRKRLDAFRDRYTSPPETTSVSVLSSLNRLEVGDIVRDRMPNVRDYAGQLQNIDRSFEIQRRSCDYITGDVTLELFGSTAPASVEGPNNTGSGNALPDAFYNSAGTELSTVATIVVVGGVGVIQAGTYNLTAGTYYYLGDLELADGATLTINGTVTIRVRGFFTINGDIDGVGRGKAGQAGAGDINNQVAGLPGFLGNSRGMDGVVRNGGKASVLWTWPCALTTGLYAAFPYLEITVSGSSIVGIPADLAGTSGGAGGKLGSTGNANPSTATVHSNGGTGGDSGAGLVIVCRGLAFGASGSIDLSGDDSAATSPITVIGQSIYPGAGGAGAPGAMLILLDGSSISVPDLGGKFTAACGAVPVNGTPLTERRLVGRPVFAAPTPIAGYLDESMISNVDLSNVAYRIQYIPQEETPQDDQELKPPTPTGLSAVGGERIVTIRVIPGGPLGPNDSVEVFASIDNNRANAVRFGWGSVTEFTHDLPSGGLRYYWARIRREVVGPDIFSDFLPESATGGLAASALDFVGELPGNTGTFLDTFEHQDYARFYSLDTGTPVITYPANGENGGRVFSSQGKAQISWKNNIPYNSTQLYLMTVKARMTVAPSDPAKDNFYAGVVGIAADGVTKIQTNGGSSGGIEHYVAANNFNFGGVTLGQWQTFRGYLLGHSGSPAPAPAPSSTNPMEMYTGVRFIRPTFATNVEGGDGVMEVDYVRIDRVVVTTGMGPNSVTDSAMSDAGTGFISYPDMSPGSSFLAEHEPVYVTFENTHSEPIVAEVSTTGLFGISATELSGINRWAVFEVLNGADTYEEDGGEIYSISSTVDPDRKVRASTVSVVVPAGSSIRARILIFLRAFAGTYTGIPDTLYNNLIMKVVGYLR